ncbi:MAG: sulfotransferase [Fidelibacterota bacterium]|nr:MAG: sulfotransferase [Candidatus Neomarinimicrobiota bacterium]
MQSGTPYSLGHELHPVIIIGAGRSGTKFVRSILAASRMCWIIPYDVGYIWRYRNESYPHDALPPEIYDERIARFIRRQLVKLAHVPKHHTQGFIVEKSVPNTLRVAFVNAVLPDARFLHLIRDGRDVVESAVRQWNQNPDPRYLLKKIRYFPFSNMRYAFWYLKNMIGGKQGTSVWGPRYPGIEDDVRKLSTLEVCARQWHFCLQTALDDLSTLPPDRQLTVRYEDLISDENTVEGVCRFLSLPDTEDVLAYYRENILRDTRGKWQQLWSSAELQQVMDHIAPTLSRLNYT